MDSFPIKENQRDRSLKTRDAILSFIKGTMTPIEIRDLKVAKTAAVKQRDTEEICGLDGEIHGYNVRLQQMNAKAESALSEYELKQKEKSEVDREIVRLESILKDKDSEVAVVAAEWSLEKEWKFLQWQKEKFDFDSEWEVVQHTTWDNGHLRWKNVRVSKFHATGTVEGQFMRGLYANVTLKTEKRKKYAKQIADLNAKLKTVRTQSEKFNSYLENYQRQRQEFNDEIQLLKVYINDKNKRKEAISSDYLSVEEAYGRLQSFK